MSKEYFRRLGFGLCGMLFTTGAFAVQTIWPAVSTPAAALIGDYYGAQCGQKAPAPYTGSLLIQSKYDQADASKSTLATSVDADSREVKKQLESFMKGLVKYSKSFERAKSAKNATESLACFDQWLEAWSQGGALLSSNSNGTGAAARKWTLAAISASILRTRALSNNAYQPSSTQKDWLKQVAQRVIGDYGARQRNPASVYFNNHDYWAAWAVASTGMVLDRDDFILWADTTLRLAFEQITPSDLGDYAYLPLEAARGSLGADYSNYAFVPLMLLVETMQYNGHPLDTEEERKLQLLANFTARITLDPGNIPELNGQLTEYLVPDSPACAAISSAPAEFWWAVGSEGDTSYSPASGMKGRIGFGAGVSRLGSGSTKNGGSVGTRIKAFARHFFKLSANKDNKSGMTGSADPGSIPARSPATQSPTAQSPGQSKDVCAPVARAVPLDSALLSLEQQAVDNHKKSWLIPFLARYPRHDWARRLYKDASGTGTIGDYGQIGGDIRPFYPGVE